MTVPLRFAGQRRTARLRELTGRDESAVTGPSTPAAIALLDALLEDGAAAELVAADRDRLLAALHLYAFGDRIESTLTCAQCAQPFDLHFSLSGLMESIDRRTPSAQWKALGDGRFENASGETVRLPTGSDELAVAALPLADGEDVLRRRAEWPDDEVLEEIAPLVDLELVAPCAECRHPHTVRFDIQSYFLTALAAERRRLLAETHRIAAAYSWSLAEILSLTRNDRRAFVELIQNERVA